MATAGGCQRPLTHYRRRKVRNSIYRYRKIYIDYRSKFVYRFISSIPIIYGNTMRYINSSLIISPKLTSHACALLINNVGKYLYLNNGSFKFEVDPHQFNLRLHHFSQFQRKEKNQKLAGLWLAGEVANRIGIYGSRVAEGLSAFQRRCCSQLARLNHWNTDKNASKHNRKSNLHLIHWFHAKSISNCEHSCITPH